MVRCWQNDLQDLVTKSTSLNMVTKSTHPQNGHHIHSWHDKSTWGEDGKHCFIEPPLEELGSSTPTCATPFDKTTTPYFSIRPYKVQAILYTARPNRIIGAFGVYDTLPFRGSTSQGVYSNIPHYCPTLHSILQTILYSRMPYSASQNNAT